MSAHLEGRDHPLVEVALLLAVVLLDDVAEEDVRPSCQFEGAFALLARRERFDLADERASRERVFVDLAVHDLQVCRGNAAHDDELVRLLALVVDVEGDFPGRNRRGRRLDRPLVEGDGNLGAAAVAHGFAPADARGAGCGRAAGTRARAGTTARTSSLALAARRSTCGGQ